MESTLADTYRDLQGEVGWNLGYGRGVDNGDEQWSDDVTRRIKAYLKSGLRQFYFPPPDNAGVSHVWSFLSPHATLTLPQDTSTIILPLDFEGIEGKISVSLGTTSSGFSLLTSGRAREMYVLYPSETGQPQHISIEPQRGGTAKHGPRKQLVVWPLPDQEYTLTCAYSIIPNFLTGELPYAYGGVEHAETLLESCLAIAEERNEDLPRQAQVHGPKFREMLASSISRDRLKRPGSYGFMTDRSDGLERRFLSRTSWAPITYNGDSID